MGYIELINNMWMLREQGIISAKETDLYMYLLNRCNRLGWKNPFNQPTAIVCASLGITRHALTNSRNKLKQSGLIDFNEGTTKGKPAEYFICGLKNENSLSKKDRLCYSTDTQCDTQHDTECSTQCDTQSVTQHSTIHKTITRQDNKDKDKRFNPPTLEEVKAYCRERGNSVDPERFYDFYQSKGWMVGKNKMKDWKAAVRTWEKTQNNGTHKQNTKEQRDEEFARHIAQKMGYGYN